MKKYSIDEIFKSIQGEGFNFGKEFVFVRFYGCNFDCSWCDQPTHINLEVDEDELVAMVEEYKIKSVLFTGGEPTLQLTDKLVKRFKDLGYYIAIETNGSNLVPIGVDYITVSPKISLNKEIVSKEASEVRIAVGSLEVKKYIDVKNEIKASKYFLSPIYLEKENRFDFETLSKVYDALREEDFRISIQLHKLMGVR